MSRRADPFAALSPQMRIVVLRGKEAFLISEGTRRYAEVLEAAFGPLDRFHFDGRTAPLADVLDELRSFALIQRHKLVIVDEADAFLAGGRRPGDSDDDDAADDGDGANRRRAMEAYAANPTEEASLLMRAESWRAGRIDKLIRRVGAIIACDPLKDADAVAWCVQEAPRRHGSRIEPAAARDLVERLGPGLSRLDSELAKLATFVGEGGPIGRRQITELVGRSREEKAWALQSAILSGRPETAVTQLRELIEVSQLPGELVMWAITDLLRRLHAAARLTRRGARPPELRSTLRLFGESGERIVELARRADPNRIAQLLQVAV